MYLEHLSFYTVSDFQQSYRDFIFKGKSKDYTSWNFCFSWINNERTKASQNLFYARRYLSNESFQKRRIHPPKCSEKQLLRQTPQNSLENIKDKIILASCRFTLQCLVSTKSSYVLKPTCSKSCRFVQVCVTLLVDTRY